MIGLGNLVIAIGYPPLFHLFHNRNIEIILTILIKKDEENSDGKALYT